jgi:hypothetical protein
MKSYTTFIVAAICCLLLVMKESNGFTSCNGRKRSSIPSPLTNTPRRTQQQQRQHNRKIVLAAKMTETKEEESTSGGGVFSESVQQEAREALESVGWARPMDGEGEMTSEDPFVKQIDAGIQRDFGVGLDDLLNPAKVVNLERELYNLRTELATLTRKTDDDETGQVVEVAGLSTEECDGGGGGEEADAVRAKIAKKETDLALERRSVFRDWLKNIFIGQAVISFGISYVMATNPKALFGGFDWFYSYNMYVYHVFLDARVSSTQFCQIHDMQLLIIFCSVLFDFYCTLSTGIFLYKF